MQHLKFTAYICHGCGQAYLEEEWAAHELTCEMLKILQRGTDRRVYT